MARGHRCNLDLPRTSGSLQHPDAQVVPRAISRARPDPLPGSELRQDGGRVPEAGIPQLPLSPAPEGRRAVTRSDCVLLSDRPDGFVSRAAKRLRETLAERGDAIPRRGLRYTEH